MTTNDILDRTSSVFGADRVYGPAHTQDGITVIPAATVPRRGEYLNMNAESNRTSSMMRWVA